MIDSCQRMIREQNNSAGNETLGIKNNDSSSKCTKRSRQVGTAFENKEKTKGRSNSHGR
jgi:hypothetical protein